MPNTTGDSCATCFFFETQYEYDKLVGRKPFQVCRRRAPKIVRNPAGAPVSLWPRVEAGDWCGDLLIDYPDVFEWKKVSGSLTNKISPGSGSFTFVSPETDGYQFAQIGKLCVYRYDFLIVTNGTAATSLVLQLPVKPKTKGAAWGTRHAAGAPAPPMFRLAGIVDPVSQTAVYTLYNGTYPGGDGTKFELAGVYEI